MWPYHTPCQERPEFFRTRRAGEEYMDYVMRADAARMICETQCDRADDCEDYTIRVAATGISAGSLYEEGVKLPWPALRADTGKRQSRCCAECEEQYTTQKNFLLCPNCRRKDVLFCHGGGSVGEGQPAFIGYNSCSEAA